MSSHLNFYALRLVLLYASLSFFCSPAKAQIDSILFTAIKSCDFSLVQKRLNGKININAVDNNGANALTWAVYYCDLPMVKYLVQHGARVSDSAVIYINEDIDYFTSLQGIAAHKGKLELLQYLADSLQLSLNEKAFNPYRREKTGLTPLSYAAENGHIDIVKYLLQKGVQIDVLDNNETSTPLIRSAESEQWAIFNLLMRTDATKKRFGKQAEHFMAAVAKLKQPYPTLAAKELKVRQFTLDLRKAYFGESSPGYAAGLNRVAVAHENVGEYEKAEHFYQMAIDLLKRISGEDHPQYIVSLNGLAFTYYNTAQYEKAIPLLERAQTVIRKIYGEENPGAYNLRPQGVDSICCRTPAAWPCAYNLTLQALMYGRMGKYDKGLTLYRQALAITKMVMGEEHPANAFILSNFAFLYTRMGLYKEAISLYQEELVIIKKENSDNRRANLFDLAHAYCQLGQYKEALPLFEQALPIMKKSFGEKHQYYAMIVDGLAFIYEHIGENNKAKFLYEQALTIYKEAFGEDHPYCASALNSLASLYMGTGEYNKALPLYQQALAIRKKSLKEEHPDYAQSLTNLAVAYESKEQYDTAMHLYGQALALTKKAVGQEHHYYANCLANLASLYVRTGRYDTALHLYQQALEIRKKVLGDDYPGNVSILNSLGWLYRTLDNGIDGTPLLIEACNLQLKHLNHTYSTLSEHEKMIFLNKEAYQFSYLPSLLYLQGTGQPSLLQQLYANELALKGMVLENQENVLVSIRKTGDSLALSLYDQWRFNKAFLGKQLLLPIKQRVSYFDSLKEVTNQSEQDLSRRTAAFGQHLRSQGITVNAISQKVLKGQAAVEFIRFPLYNTKWTDSTMYAALILLHGDSLAHFIPLCEEKQLLRLLGFSADSASDDVVIEHLYGDERGAGTLSDSLYQLTWKPLEKYLDGVHTIYYAPAGLLHRIAFQALRTDATHFLIDKYRLNQVLSTRSIVLPEQVSSKLLSASVWGHIEYSMNNSVASRQLSRGQQHTRGQNTVDTTASSFNFYNSDTRGSHGGGWHSLPATKGEMDSLQKVFRLAGIAITSFSGALASEEAFKALDGRSAQVLHLATHGFFLPVAESKPNSSYDLNAGDAFKVQRNPMFRSGLILARGNYAWKGEPAIPGREDGILTAYEIAQMDLSNTNLVVLSACETALGDLQGNEGVIGLQRAFKMAGVKQMIMTLWSVYDEITRELMTLFYRNWLRGQSTREALRNAQLKIKEQYPEPYHWAAFMVVE